MMSGNYTMEKSSPVVGTVLVNLANNTSINVLSQRRDIEARSDCPVGSTVLESHD